MFLTHNGNTRPKCTVSPLDSTVFRTSLCSVTDSAILHRMPQNFFHPESSAAALGIFSLLHEWVRISFAIQSGGLGSPPHAFARRRRPLRRRPPMRKDRSPLLITSLPRCGRWSRILRILSRAAQLFDCATCVLESGVWHTCRPSKAHGYQPRYPSSSSPPSPARILHASQRRPYLSASCSVSSTCRAKCHPDAPRSAFSSVAPRQSRIPAGCCGAYRRPYRRPNT